MIGQRRRSAQCDLFGLGNKKLERFSYCNDIE